ncbi:SAM-dependent methyltransferase [Jongsikchunia kroppenstedtii]|uniref:SAM-dependent methyltransferase n=1 Tax=Jongsikchunia kroppenstedtii TaxID=1121721 RepID=UPI000368FC59|nr:class I SAM-dependent methyltransferase [Jongsikchunia kroppenstedtii]
MRTEDDTWDINTSVGATAIGVATMRAVETHRPDAVFADPYAEMLVAETDSRFAAVLADHLAGREPAADSPIAERIRRGLGGFMVARTWFFDNYLRQAIDSGIRQFVILGAGLDARAYRLTWPAGSVLFEVDQPRVLEFKSAALAKHDAKPGVDRREVAIDLRRDWPAALRSAGFDAARPTAWLAEGLLRYLPSDALVRLLANVAAQSAPTSRFAANFNTRSAAQAMAQHQDRTRAADGARPFPTDLWFHEDDRADPEEWLAEHGWNPEHVSCHRILEQLGRDPGDHDFVGRHLLLTGTAPA